MKIRRSDVVSMLALVGAVLSLTVGRGGAADPPVRSASGAAITGRQIVDRSVTGRDLADNSLTGRQIREARLNKVPRARNADRLGGATAGSYRDRCRVGTRAVAGTCFETQARSPATYTAASTDCELTGAPPGKRLPTHNELRAAIGEPGIELAGGGELTSDLIGYTTADHPVGPGRPILAFIADNVGNGGGTPDAAGGEKAFRCVSDPIN